MKREHKKSPIGNIYDKKKDIWDAGITNEEKEGTIDKECQLVFSSLFTK